MLVFRGLDGAAELVGGVPEGFLEGFGGLGAAEDFFGINIVL